MNTNIKSEWITANAGSGKTTALTRRVVRLLLLGVSPEHIVCITYTKAAANEMRSRVLDRLRELLLLGESECAARIESILGKKPAATEMEAARMLFGRVLDSPTGGLHITTIHGFCQHLLRRFPMEAGVAPHFTVLDEAASDEALRKAKHALLTSLESAEPHLCEAMSLIGARGGETRFESLAADIIAKRMVWDRIWRAQSPESLRAHIYALHALEEGATQEALDHPLSAHLSEESCALIRAHLPTLIAHKTATYRTLGEGLAAWLSIGEAERFANPSRFSIIFLTREGERRARLLNEKEYPADHPLRIVLEVAAEAALRHQQQSAALACAEESFAIAVFAKTLLDIYAQAKAAQHALDYDDLIDYTLRLVSQPETLGWVMSKLDHRIDHLLIDEAQDNSHAQWELARILVEELIASNEGVGNANLPRSVLVVGDEKQSIYSFQGAAPEQFARNHGLFSAMLSGSAAPLADEALERSYRSAPAILTLVDHVCSQPTVAVSINASGICQPHQLVREDASGHVAVYPLVALTEAEEKAEPLTIPTTYRIQANAAHQLAEEIARTIHHWLHVEKRELISEGRPLRAGDILILVKNRHPYVQPLIRSLQQHHVAVAGLDRLLLADHLAVQDLLALMRWCDNTGDDLALAQVLRSPLIGMRDDALRAHAHNRPGTLWQHLCEPWLAQVLRWKAYAPYDFLTQILEVSGKRREFARRFGEEVHEVLDELKAQAAAMPVSKQPTLAEFQEWIVSSTRSIKREQENGAQDVVRIMTVHGAKGLEAPVVIMADTVNVPSTQRERLFIATSAHGQSLPVMSMSDLARGATGLAQAKQQRLDEIMAEYYRLLYVALTRARDELHVFGAAGRRGELKETSWYSVIVQSARSLGAEEENDIVALRDAPKAITKKSATVVAAQSKPLPAWATESPAATTSLAVLKPSGFAVVAQPSCYVVENAYAAKERGVRIHRVLELLRVDSTIDAIGQLVHYVAPEWSAEEKEKAIKEIATLHAQERWIWEHRNSAEVNIAGSIAGAAISGQIDMLINTPESLVILDYKTGAHIPDEAEVPENYVLQLKTYREVIQQIHPTRSVRCAILWTHGPTLMWLDEAVEKAEFPIAVSA